MRASIRSNEGFGDFSGLGFRVWDLNAECQEPLPDPEFKVSCFGVRAPSSGLRVNGLWFMVYGLWFMVWMSGLRV